MEAAALRDERLIDRATTQAWQTATFALSGYSGGLKNKTLADYLISEKRKPKRSTTAKAVAFFHAMKAAGYPVKIERLDRMPD